MVHPGRSSLNLKKEKITGMPLVLTTSVSTVTLHSVPKLLLLRKTTCLGTIYQMESSRPRLFILVTNHGEDTQTVDFIVEASLTFILILTMAINLTTSKSGTKSLIKSINTQIWSQRNRQAKMDGELSSLIS